MNVRENIMKKKPDHIKQEDWDAVESPPLSNKVLSRMQPVKKAHPDMPSRVHYMGRAGKQRSMKFSLTTCIHIVKTTPAFNPSVQLTARVSRLLVFSIV